MSADTRRELPADCRVQPTGAAVPELTQAQLAELRGRLQSVFKSLALIHDVIEVGAAACRDTAADGDNELEHVLRRCASAPLISNMVELSLSIELLGGTTQFL